MPLKNSVSQAGSWNHLREIGAEPGASGVPHQHNFSPDLTSAEVATGLMTSLLSNPDVRSAVTEADGQVVGSNFVWKYMPVAE